MIAILKDIRIEIINDDPQHFKGQSLIMPNSNDLDIKTGINGIILNKVGSINKDINRDTKNGNAVIIGSGNLENYQYIIFSCFVDKSLKMMERLSFAGQSIVSALDIAYKNGIREIVFSHFPPYITGIPVDKITNVLFKVSLAYLKRKSFIKRIIYLTESSFEYDIYSQNLKQLMSMF